jgi:hypothetical protein
MLTLIWLAAMGGSILATARSGMIWGWSIRYGIGSLFALATAILAILNLTRGKPSKWAWLPLLAMLPVGGEAYGGAVFMLGVASIL